MVSCVVCTGYVAIKVYHYQSNIISNTLKPSPLFVTNPSNSISLSCCNKWLWTEAMSRTNWREIIISRPGSPLRNPSQCGLMNIIALLKSFSNSQLRVECFSVFQHNSKPNF